MSAGVHTPGRAVPARFRKGKVVNPVYPAARPPTLQQAAQRAWAIRRLFFAGAVDRRAALQALDTIYTTAANPRLRRLCETVAFSMFPEVAPSRAPSQARPQQ